ncbi:hypothetical protein ACEVJL_15640 [Pseudoflavonifractor sp. P01025]|jgi:hypothetical protein|uniref:hypothetical protein n=1 Tax=Eubacteriales TaxID=186802 RepID=UPI001123411F|nr:hypothetical protein [Flavonifractor sp. An91]
MSGSNALTVPLTLILGLSLSTIPAGSSTNIAPTFSYQIESSYQTTSLNVVAKEFGNTSFSPRHDALALFGEQSNFSPEEQMTYRAMLKENSENVGINIFDLF